MPTDPVLPPQLPPPLPSAGPVRRRFRPTAWLAWLVIIGVCVALPLLRAERHAPSATTAPAIPAAVDFQTELAGRFWVGLNRIAAGDRQRVENFVGMPRDTAVQRIAAAIVLADQGQRKQAAELLRATADDPAAAALLDQYTKPTTGPAATAPSPSEPATTHLTEPTDADARPQSLASPGFAERFGWFAELARVYGRPDSDPARAAVLAGAVRTVWVTGGAFTLVAVAGVTGLGLFVTAIVLLATGRLRFRVGPPAGAAHVYVEAMAIYLGGFVLASLLIALLLPNAPLPVQVAGLGLATLVAAVWPRVRGVRWADQRLDWGIHLGRNPLVEIGAGVLGYLAGLPVMAVGLGVTIAILSATHVDATHPIVQQASDHSAMGVLSLYFIASVFAPLTEELMFRGALVSHLRAGVGVVAAALLSGLVFAAVHPQGWAVVPALMSVGAVLACVRQWRGTLLASITAHALHNGFLITILTLATR